MKQFILLLLVVAASFSGGFAYAQDDHNDGAQKILPGPDDVTPPDPTPTPDAASSSQ